MNEMLEFENGAIVICHFRQDQEMSDRMGVRVVHYQAVIDNSKESPSGEYIRFDCSDKCEINGWVLKDDIIIDEVLEKLNEERVAA
jgi:hypothetical protein